jgi:transposase
VREAILILLPRAVRVYMALAPTNLRKSFDGLSNDVRTVLALDPLSGHLFVFLNRRKNQVKLLLWTRGGFTIVQKRLERGTFAFPKQVNADAKRIEMDIHELSMLLEGIDVTRARASRRWEPPAHARGA